MASQLGGSNHITVRLDCDIYLAARKLVETMPYESREAFVQGVIDASNDLKPIVETKYSRQVRQRKELQQERLGRFHDSRIVDGVTGVK